MILLIDNYDSFTYNLVQYLGELETDVRVVRNDALSVEEIRAMKPEKIVISPGPGTPDDAGISTELIRQLGAEIPLLGVCLGHQCIGKAFGGDVVRAEKIMHGKISSIRHTNSGPLFQDIPSPFNATRYHSLIIRRETFPDVLTITAETEDKEIMAVAHKEYPLWGVQFHPESILTSHGMQIVRNFVLM